MQPGARSSSDTITGWLTQSAHTGHLLRFRRVGAGLSRFDIAQVDGRWTWRDVVTIESMRAPVSGDVSRYLAALHRLEGG